MRTNLLGPGTGRDSGQTAGDQGEVYGAEAVAVTAGTSRTYEELNSRFLNLFGSPNQVRQAQICHGNSAVVATMVYGWWPYWMSTEKLENTQCILMMGRDPRPNHQTIWEGMLEAQKRGAKLIAVDSRRSSVAARADLWLQLSSGTARSSGTTYVRE